MKAVVHIGIEKTGTTTIQEFLHINRSYLLSKGIAFLKSPGLRNHRKLATFCMDFNYVDDHIKRLGLIDENSRLTWREAFQKEYLSELDTLSKNIHTVIISSEHFHSRLASKKSINRLFDLLSKSFSIIKIIVYLRRQDEVAVSLYSTALKKGIVLEKILPDTNENKAYYNYYTLLSKWSYVFGCHNIIPIIFERKKLKNENLIEDFIENCHFQEFAHQFVIPEKKNEALSAYAQNFLKIFNKNCSCYFKDNQKQLNDFRRVLIHELQKKHKGLPMLPSKKEAIDFYSRFEQSNQKVANDWFNGELFDLDFSKYPLNDQMTNITNSVTVDDVMIEFLNVFNLIKS